MIGCFSAALFTFLLLSGILGYFIDGVIPFSLCFGTIGSIGTTFVFSDGSCKICFSIFLTLVLITSSFLTGASLGYKKYTMETVIKPMDETSTSLLLINVFSIEY